MLQLLASDIFSSGRAHKWYCSKAPRQSRVWQHCPPIANVVDVNEHLFNVFSPNRKCSQCKACLRLDSGCMSLHEVATGASVPRLRLPASVRGCGLCKPNFFFIVQLAKCSCAEFTTQTPSKGLKLIALSSTSPYTSDIDRNQKL